MTADELGPLEAALEVTGSIIEAVAGDQWDLPSPCTEWTVRQVAEHLIRGNDLFTRALGGEASASPPADGGMPRAFHESGARLLAAFRQPGVMDQVAEVPFGSVPARVALSLRVTEVLVHGWDLARATGQAPQFPEEVAEGALAFTGPMLERIPPGPQPFGVPQPVDPAAPAIDRLAALLGRTVSRSVADT